MTGVQTCALPILFERQEHYAGNWDVFRPATEIEEMNIFTAESLNELLREAEKIMEGWTDYR